MIHLKDRVRIVEPGRYAGMYGTVTAFNMGRIHVHLDAPVDDHAYFDTFYLEVVEQ